MAKTPAKRPKVNKFPVIMYPEGVEVGRVTSGRERDGGPVRHVAFTTDGRRVGTFDTFAQAKTHLIEAARRTAEQATQDAKEQAHLTQHAEMGADCPCGALYG